MAKKAASKSWGKSRGKRKGKSKSKRAGAALNSTNLKFIGAAFDQVITDLAIVRSSVVEKSDVDALVKRLEQLKLETSRECPQNWYAIYTLEE